MMWTLKIAAQFLWMVVSPFVLLFTVLVVRAKIRNARREKIRRKIDRAMQREHDLKARSRR